MKLSLRKSIAAAAAIGLLGSLAGVAHSDQVYNDLDNVVDAAAETLSLTAGGSGSTVTLSLTASNTDGPDADTVDSVGGCNLGGNVNTASLWQGGVTAAGAAARLKLTATSSDTGAATVTSPAAFTDCASQPGYQQTITVTPVATGTATISFAIDSANSKWRAGSTTRLVSATFTVNVAAAPNSNPCDAVAVPAAPTFAHAPNGSNGWYKTVPTVSAASTTAGATVTYGTTSGGPYGAAPTLTDGQTTVYAIATSATCNKVSSESSQLYKVDTTNPTVTITTPPAPSAGVLPQYELGQTVLADFACGDTVSDIQSCVGTVNDAAAIDTSSEGTKSFTVDATDNAGNTFGRTHQYTVVDSVPPAITFDATGGYLPTGNSGWFKTSPATVKVTATDPSGVTALECTDSDDDAVTLTNNGSNATSMWGDISTSTEGQSAFSCGATDGADTPNTTGTADRATHTLKLDTVAPAVTVTNVANNATYLLGQVPVAGCNTTDVSPGSGVLTSATIAAAPTNTLGSHTVTCAGAADVAGNTGSASVTYRVVSYTVTFQQPIDSGGVRNIAKLGRVLPVKMTVVENDGSGTPVAITNTSSVPVYLGYVKTPCSSNTPSDTIEEWAAGSSATGNQFNWDTTALRWHYNLDTRKITSTANTCYRVEVFVGGTVNSSQIASGGLLAGSFTLEITK